jgi:ribosomal protein S18 acetylase RimI-like enzyme
MHALEIRSFGSPRLERGNGIAQVGAANAFEYCIESLGALGMPRPCKMFEVSRMSGEQHGHAVGRYLAIALSELPFHPVKPAMQSLTGAPLILRAGGVVARVRPWAFEPNVAHLVLYNQSRLPAPSEITSWISQLRTAGYDTIRTGALGAQAGARFERLGFESIQSLVLLEHTGISSAGTGPASKSSVSTVRLATEDDPKASRVDVGAFGSGWCIDRVGIGDVRSATPRHRARAIRVDNEIVAYAISGRDGRNGYIQRLAVSPAHQHQGHGLTLIGDSLRWMARWRVRRALVNTHTGNHAALALYHRLGFRDLSDRLHVFERRIE